MIARLLPVAPLLLGSALLLFAGGLNGLILPLHGAEVGFSSGTLGLLGTGYAVGYVLGCIYAPRIVGAVGHIRSYSSMCAFAGIAILLQALAVEAWLWIPLRGVSGFCFAGAAMIVESWLNDRAEPKTRGAIFSVYSMVNLGAVTLGQLAIPFGDVSGDAFFIIGGIFYCLALAPTALSRSASPPPLTSVRLDLRALWRNSPVAVAAVLLVGVSNASFGTLAAVYAGERGLDLSLIALFSSIPLLAGALAQVPFGYLSDRVDRRGVLVGAAAAAMAADLAFILVAPEGRVENMILVSCFGAFIYAMYPVIVAHANDHAPPGTAIQVSGGLLMTFGVGSIVGPLAAGAAMAQLGPAGLFWTTCIAHGALILFTLIRMIQRAAPTEEEKIAFKPILPARAATPETAALAEGEEEAAPLAAE